jgi:inosine/xanthosine triphosphatase
MKVIVGSLNPIKIEAVQEVFLNAPYLISGASVGSKVRSQPLSHQETRQGAINRAKGCVLDLGADMGFGLEGGVFVDDGLIYLCNWGAIVDRENNLFVVSGPTFQLPSSFMKPLFEGVELNDLMQQKIGVQGLGSKEGVMGYFTKGQINRKEVFTQMARILWGQYLFQKEQNFH